MRVPVVAVAMPLVQLIESKNKRGQGDGLRTIRQTLCNSKLADRLAAISSSRVKNKNCPVTKAAGLRRSILAVDGDAIKLHTMVDQTIAQPFRNDFLQCLKLRVDKFDDFASFDINQMVVMRLGRCLIPRATIAEIMPVQYASLFKQADGPIYRGNRDFGINRRRTAVKLLHIGVVGRIGNDARDDPPLIGYA
jgi:hypothetical protein